MDSSAITETSEGADEKSHSLITFSAGISSIINQTMTRISGVSSYTRLIKFL
jgi:hypothetical protein